MSRTATRRSAGPVSRPAVLAATLTALLLLAACGWTKSDPATTTLAFPPETNVPYGSFQECNEGVDPCSGAQNIDIYRSDEDGPNPVVIWLHGGGFVGGDKATGVNENLEPLLQDGWDIVAANYRLSAEGGVNPFPAAVNDVKRVVRWVKANAADNDWDPNAVAAIGHSAGGNLAAMLAVTADEPELEDPGLPQDLLDVDSSVIAAIAIAPVSDVQMFGELDFWGPMVDQYVDCAGCPEIRQLASVAPWVDGSAAPLLILHGDRDTVAGPEHADAVIAAYDAADISDRLRVIIIDDGPEDDRGHNPDFGRWVDTFVEFLDAALRDQDSDEQDNGDEQGVTVAEDDLTG